MKRIPIYPVIILILFMFSCNDKEHEPTLKDINGFIQKGPFLNGTSITISELNSDLSQTGKQFSTQILDNKGDFEIKNIELSSNYVELNADGFYFNEIENESSSAQLTLFALADITNKSTLNVNVLSSLEKSRVEYLISNGSSFNEAKKQAQSEILKIFEISKSDISVSENLDISKTGEENAILLAVSVILQGYLSVAELSELLANISVDIREDGEINTEALGQILLKNAKTLKTEEIRGNLEIRYKNMGVNVEIPEFEKYVNQFIDNTDFVLPELFEYPENGKYGTNLLFKDKTEYVQGKYSLCAILAEGTSLKVKIQGKNWLYPVSQDWSGWEKSSWNLEDDSRTFTSKKTGQIDLEINLSSESSPTITKLYIYENNEIEPTWTKEIRVN